MMQTKQELRDGGGGGSSSTTLDLSETSAEEALGRKRRPSEQDLSSAQHQMGSYLLQSSAGAIPASHAQIPANIWMVANSNNQVMSGDPIWTFPPVNNYRGAMSSGLHFMNFPTPMALLPSQQQLGGSSSSGGGGNNNNNINMNEGHLSMLAGLSPYRPVSESTQPSGSQSHHHHHRGGGGSSHDHHRHDDDN